MVSVYNNQAAIEGVKLQLKKSRTELDKLKSQLAADEESNFFNYYRDDPIAFASAITGWELQDFQKRAMTSTSTRMLFNCCRQSGKTMISACISLYKALFTPKSLICIISRSMRQSSEMLKKISAMLPTVPYDSFGISIKYHSALQLEFSNGSRILSLPGNEFTIRGFSGVDILVVDEASLVFDAVFYEAGVPMIAAKKDSRIICLSTPHGKRGFFYELWADTKATNWERYQLTADECPHITQEFLDEWRARLSPRAFEQEFYCEFGDDVGSVFSNEAIENAAIDMPDYDFTEGIEGLI